MFEDFKDIERPTDQNALSWFEYGLKKGLKQKEAKSRWILDDEERIVCRNCRYIAPYDFNRGYCTGSYCAQCGFKMEELQR